MKKDNSISLPSLVLIIVICSTIFWQLVKPSHNKISPVDDYIQATITSDSLNNASHADAQKFIDSINAAHSIKTNG